MMYGLFTAIACVIISLVLHFAGLSLETWAAYIAYIPFLIGVILNANAYAKANDNYVTFGNVFSSGFKMSAIVTLIMLAWAFLSLAIFPETKEQALEMAREKMADDPRMTDEQIDMAIDMTRKYFTVGMIMGVVFGYMFVGAIFSLIGAAIPKKKGQRVNQIPQ
jgi:uncharacterized protein YbaA (DUF1428 family)